jgi:aspartate-semialdehyde dehydrogenase
VNPERLRKAPNIAIVGASSPLGKELREILEASAFPVGKLSLLETEEYAGLLQEFAGEIRITQIISPEVFAEVDIAFFACSPEIMGAYVASGAPLPDLTIDLTQPRAEGMLFLDGISAPGILNNTGYFINPHPAAIVIARVLAQLSRAYRIEGASVTVLLPASERGSAGVDELQEQTIGLLNFQQVETRTFSGQLAFNLLTENEVARQTEERIRHHLLGLLKEPPFMPAIAAIQAPVFHSHSFSMFVTLGGSPDVADIENCLSESHGTFTLERDAITYASPVTVVGTDSIHVGRLLADPSRAGTYFLWLVADNVRIAAQNAIRIAEGIILAPASPR